MKPDPLRLPLTLLVFSACALLAGACGGRPGAGSMAERARMDEHVRINQIQVLGSHNSYKEAIDPSLMRILRQQDSSMAQALDYTHVTLREQLDLGLRNLELDVLHDPEGGRYAEPLGLQLVAQAGLQAGPPYDERKRMLQPGFKVLHVQDLDFRSNCLTLRDCLGEIEAWSEAHPDHLPIIITVNAKDGGIDRPGFVRPLPFTEAAFAALDREIVDVLGADGLIRPDDVRGSYETLEEAVRAGNWPVLGAARGKVLFVLDETGEKLGRYVAGHPSLRGRTMFANAPEGTPEAAFLIVNEPVRSGERIARLVQDGYMVRTRADANTVEARTGETARREAAFRSGAQVVTTDYYRPDHRFGTAYQVRLPGGLVARCNPVAAPAACRSEHLE